MLNISKNFLKYDIICLSLALFLIACFTTDAAKNKDSQKEIKASYLRAGLLNSARIQEKFGSFGVEILAQDKNKGLRLSSLYSLLDGQKISRTIALTKYIPTMNNKLKAAHEEILSGGSIGSTLKKHGFDLKKEFFFQGIVTNMPPKTQALMHTTETNYASLAYDLVVSMDGHSQTYSTIAEVYSPAFLNLSELTELLVNESTAGNYLLKQASAEKIEHIFDQLRAELKSL